MAQVTSAAGKFASFCEENGWAAERIKKNNGDTKIVEATGPDGAVVTAEWYKGAALGPAIGYYISASGGIALPIKNAAMARRIIAGEFIPEAPKPRKPPTREKKAENDDGEPRVIKPNLDFDPHTITDSKLLLRVAGRKITWSNTYGYESGTVPPLARMAKVKRNGVEQTIEIPTESVKITMSRSEDTIGERILNFCSLESGYRALFVDALVRVDR